ncbi:MAG TPA: hypothetical protein VFL93_09090 [Longimicrobiaceae bacterium]|nr:hypothetical protein [Longimicrobiaceae bacterium]
MDQQNQPHGGPANTPPFGREPGAVQTADGHQIPADTERDMRAAGSTQHSGGSMPETERELERTRDLVAETAAPVMAEQMQEAIEQTADKLAHDPQAREQMKRTAQAVEHDAKRMARQKVDEISQRAENRVNQGMDRAADRIGQAAQSVDQMAAERLNGGGIKGQAGQMAHSLADTMESVAGYLRNNDAQDLRSDLQRQLRERPLQTLLIAVAAGWAAGKILR